jgi:hypothetical protein
MGSKTLQKRTENLLFIDVGKFGFTGCDSTGQNTKVKGQKKTLASPQDVWRRGEGIIVFPLLATFNSCCRYKEFLLRLM